MIKVLLFTAQDLGNDVVAFLRARSDVRLWVVTQRTKRDEIYGYRSTFDLCLQDGVPMVAAKPFGEEFFIEVENIAPDLVVCAFYPRILPARLLKIPPLGCINVHPGRLPYYRGPFSTPWCILNGEREIGITLHYMDAGIDTGDILVQRMHPIGEEETGHQLHRRSMKLCGELLFDNFDKMIRGELKARPQPPGGSYYNRIEPQHRIDWHSPRRLIRNQVRVHAKPYFPAYSFLFNTCVAINRVNEIDLADDKAQGAGLIRAVFDDGRFAVSCVDGCLLIEEFEMFPVLGVEDMRLHIRVGNRFS